MKNRVRGDTLREGNTESLLHVRRLLLGCLAGEPIEELCENRVAAGTEHVVQHLERPEVKVAKEVLTGTFDADQKGGETRHLVQLLGGTCNGYTVNRRHEVTSG